MNKLLHACLALAAPALTIAQPAFTDPSAFWYVARTFPAGAPEDPGFVGTNTRLFRISGDSVVAGETWSVFISEPTHPDGDPIQFEGLVRQEGEMVFGLREDLSTDTLYDFSLAIGDSTHYLIDGWYSVWLHVIALDSVIVDGSYRRIQHFEHPQLPPSEMRESWMEGIGSIHGPLFPAAPISFMTEVPGDSLMLTCYGSEDTTLWQHPGYADCAVNIELTALEHQARPSISVLPNPTMDQVIVSAPGIAEWRLQDGSGRLLAQASFAPQERVLVDLAGRPVGLYVISVRQRTGWSHHRLVKH